ncbi:MAG: tetratricopeptide repeat protein [Lysobacter sp.]|nr:tetratricopeptide repeat protein [Lysobacter sp.]
MATLAPLDLRREASALMRAGRVQEALLVLRALVQQVPGDFGGQYNLGFALQHLKRWDEAAAAYVRAMQLNPSFVEARVNLGNCLQEMKRFEEAELAFRDAVRLNPGLFQAHYNLGLLLRRKDRWTESVESLRAAHALAPADPDAWDYLYQGLMRLRRIEEAADAFLAWEPVAPACPELALAGLTMSRILGDAQRERRYVDLCLRWPFDKAEPTQVAEVIAQIQYFDVAQEEIGALYRRYQSFMRQKGFENYSGQMRRTRGQRVRLGYLSPDFRAHVMGKLMLSVFRLHDRERFDLYAFSLTDPRHDDAHTAAFRDLSTRFVNVSAMTDEQSARLIADHDLDILVDLTGHTQGARPGILAHKPARVVITHLGYHGCVGLDEVDFKLTDRIADDPENERFQVEKLLFMDACVFPFHHVPAAADADFTKARFGLEGKFVFGEFVNLMKLSPRLLAAWGRIFRELPEAVLAFSPLNPRDEKYLLAAAAKAGVGPERVVFLPAGKDDETRRARNAVLDAVLDTFPYSGGDTTLAALDGGVPVVTLAGRRHSERTSASILGHLGLDELVARSEDDYVALALRMARDAGYRAGVVARVGAATRQAREAGLGDYVRSLERAYLGALAQKGVRLEEAGTLAVDEFQTAFRTALAAHQAGDLDEALKAYEALVKEQPSYPPLNYFMAMLLRAKGNRARSRDLLRRALQASPAYADARVALGNLELDAGEHAAAREAFGIVTAARPERADGWTGLGLARQAGGDLDGALEAFRQGVAAAPAQALVHFNLAVALQKARRYDEAREAYRTALAIDPGSAEALYNYGLLLAELGQAELALGSWRAALASDAAFEPAYWQLRHALHAAGRIDEWLVNFEAFLRHCPASPRLALYAIDVAFHRGELAEANRCFRQAVEAVRRERDDALAAEMLEELLYVALFFDIDGPDMLALYRRYEAASRALCPQLPLLPPRPPGARIRVGYLSGDFRDHVMGRMALEILAGHDRAAFEVFGFSLSLQEDDWTGRIRAHCDHYEVVAGLGERAAAEAIARHGLDLLVDLSTHTKGSRPAILAYKPARVQVTHVASAGAVGLATVDFKLTDRLWDRPENQEFLIEKLLPMDGCVFPFRSLPRVTQPAVSRFEIGLPPGTFVFGAFVQIQKLSPRLLAVWRELFRRLPRARLAFSPLSPGAVPAYERMLEANGIDPAHALFIPQGGSDARNQARYLHVDAVLDTFPYSGTNGTLEALCQGVPVVALEGERACERSTLTILVNAGLGELVAPTPEAYVELAVRLATDEGYRKSVRAAIDDRLPKSALADNAAHVRNLEAAWRRALALSGVKVSA